MFPSKSLNWKLFSRRCLLSCEYSASPWRQNSMSTSCSSRAAFGKRFFTSSCNPLTRTISFSNTGVVETESMSTVFASLNQLMMAANGLATCLDFFVFSGLGKYFKNKVRMALPMSCCATLDMPSSSPSYTNSTLPVMLEMIP